MELPDSLALPLETGAPWWYWLGNRPALNFVNTFRERWSRQVETLVTPDDLAAWLVAAEIANRPPSVTRSLLSDARALREAIDAGVRAQLDASALPPAAAAEIDGWLARAAIPDRLVVDAQGTPQFVVGEPRDAALYAVALIAADAAAMLGTDERARVRVCASETCSARFYDRSRAGQRRWCSMAGCGNAAKARRHRERVRDA